MSSIEKNLTLIEKIALLEQRAETLGTQLGSQSEDEAVLQALADRLSLLCVNEDSLVEQFNLNMAAFQEFDLNIYNFFKDYKPERFIVDIVDGFANILDTETRSYIYDYPSYLMANVQVESYCKAPQSTSAMFDLNEENECSFLHSDSLNKVLHVLLDRIDKNAGATRALPKLINSLMVFGIGNGYHIELLAAQHNINNLYIFEPDLDLFFSSLFVANWYQILHKVNKKQLNIHLSLGEQQDTFFEDVLTQSNVNGRYDMAKTYGFIHYQTTKIKGLVKEFKQRFHETIQGWGFFDDSVMSISHMLTSMKQGVPLIKKGALNQNELSDCPVFIVGNGPSLDTLIDVIKAYQDSVIIISCGSALSALYQYGIVPDIHCEQERTSPIAEQLDYYCPAEVLDNIILWGPSTLHPDVYAKFTSKAMAAKSEEPSAPLLMESSLSEHFELYPYINPTVANTAASMALGFGFQNIYFLGVDLAHKSEGNHHSEKSIYYNAEGDDLNLYDSSNLLDYPVEGNFGDTFYTDPFFSGSRKTLEKLILTSVQTEFFNLSDGALIKGATPLLPSNMTLKREPIVDKSLKLRELISNACYQDDGALYDELSGELDFSGYEKFCRLLISSIDEVDKDFESYLLLLKSHFLMLIDDKLCPRDVFYYLLKGSVLHIQAMLTRIIYEAVDERDALDDFNVGLSHYRDFLTSSIKYYKENALKPHYYETDWFDAVKNSK